ncbi:MAG: NAD-dependent epimerase/dehydratase family protein, partial [Oscillospiraceae bacterium]|nr:NAD-dependent epimerase/dehydratase family protein [Oscillospiraceae bacterium]
MLKILVTGAAGFIGKNLCWEIANGKLQIANIDGVEILPFDMDSDPALLDEYCRDCGFVFHLAGVNRPENPDEYMTGNRGFTGQLLALLQKHNNSVPILFTSSIQAALDNPYGASKRAAEELIFAYGRERHVPVYVYRLPNVFGKWCRPNYNSAAVTFCHNIARGLPITVSDPAATLRLAYIDDVVSAFLRAPAGNAALDDDGFVCLPVTHTAALGEIVDMLYRFRDGREGLSVPDTGGAFEKKLYATYLSYLPPEDCVYPLKMNADQRGSFTEIIRTPDRGQFSVNISKPGIVKGNHWHHTKTEKFAVVSGRGVIRLRRIDCDEVTEFFVSGEQIQVVDIPPGYTHNIQNLGGEDMVTFMWCS